MTTVNTDAKKEEGVGPADFTYPVQGDLGNSAPQLGADNYEVSFQMLPSMKGPPLLLESSEQVKARYAFHLMSQKAKLAGMPESQAVEELAIITRRDAEIAAYAKIAAQYYSRVQSYFFQFRIPTVNDVESAEATTLAPRKPVMGNSSPGAGDVGPGVGTHRHADPVLSYDAEQNVPVRSRNRFRRWLAARTFVSTNYAGFVASGEGYDFPVYAAFGHLPNAVQEYVLFEVAQRISFNSDVLAFLETWAASS